MSDLEKEYRHIPVLLDEALSYLGLDENRSSDRKVFVDATLGGAGHSFEIARRLGSDGMLIGIDQDAMALRAARTRLGSVPSNIRPNIQLIQGNFGDLDDALLQAEVPGIDGILFDLGVSSPQLDMPSRGFSFKETAPLDMRMDPDKQTLTAAEVVNNYTEADLTRIIRDYSDERWAHRIAQFIVRERSRKPIETSDELVEIIKDAIPASARRRGGHPAKRTFQALRIEVNGELDVLKSGLDAAIRWLNPGGRICVIDYQSLEDRIVKSKFREESRTDALPPDMPVMANENVAVLKQVTRKPVVPTEEEIARNPRARSAKMRVAEKCKMPKQYISWP